MVGFRCKSTINMDNNANQVLDIKQFAINIEEFIHTSAKDVLSKINSIEIVSSKDDGANPTTNFDQEIERGLRDMVLEKYSGYDIGIVGEEFPLENDETSKYTIYIDPIDGTKYFAQGVPLWTTSIALTEKTDEANSEAALYAAIYHPSANDLYIAITGQGAFHNGTKMNVKDVPAAKAQIALDFAISDDIIFAYNQSKTFYTPTGQKIGNNWQAYRDSVEAGITRLRRAFYRVRDLGSGTLATAWTAKGMYLAYVLPAEHLNKRVDHIGGLLLIKEAGGSIIYTHLTDQINYAIAASTQEVCEQIKALLEY